LRSAWLVLVSLAAVPLGCDDDLVLPVPDAAIDAHASDAHANDATLPDAGAPDAIADVVYLDGPLPCDAGGPCFAPPVALVTGQSPPPTMLAVDATNVYFSNGHAVDECAIGGCGSAATTLWSSTVFYVSGIAAAIGNVYFTANTQYIAYCPATGCTNGVPTNLLSTLNAQFQGLAADDQNVYWNGNGAGIHACALGGCNETPFTYATPPNAYGLGIDDQFIAWTSQDVYVDVCPKSGCSGAPLVLTSTSWVGPVAVGGGVVYWIDQGQPNGGRNVPITQRTNGAVLACAATGCGGKPTVLATYPLWLGGGAIAADASGVYWSLEDISGTFGEIAGCAAGGCGGSPTVYATTTSTNQRLASPAIAVDAANVYWVDPGVGGVFQTPRK
jgi:hypothetical protein